MPKSKVHQIGVARYFSDPDLTDEDIRRVELELRYNITRYARLRRLAIVEPIKLIVHKGVKTCDTDFCDPLDVISSVAFRTNAQAKWPKLLTRGLIWLLYRLERNLWIRRILYPYQGNYYAKL